MSHNNKVFNVKSQFSKIRKYIKIKAKEKYCVTIIWQLISITIPKKYGQEYVKKIAGHLILNKKLRANKNAHILKISFVCSCIVLVLHCEFVAHVTDMKMKLLQVPLFIYIFFTSYLFFFLPPGEILTICAFQQLSSSVPVDNFSCN